MRVSDTTIRLVAWGVVLSFGVIALANVPLIFTEVPDVEDWGGSSSFIADTLFVALVLTFPLVGLLIVRQQPRNRIGMLLVLIGAVWAVGGLMDTYVSYAVTYFPALPGPEVLAALGSGIWVPGIGLMATYLILLFPDGHLPSPGWRHLARLTGVVLVVIYLAVTFSPGELEDTMLPAVENPLGVDALEPYLQVAFMALAALPLCIVGCAAGLIVRFRRSTGVERVQLKWLATAAAIIAVLYLVAMVSTMVSALTLGNIDGNDDSAFMLVIQNLAILSFVLIPISIGIAILKHGLYGIDSLISRALVFGALGLFVTGVYVGIVVGIGAAIGQQQTSVWLSILATAVVAIAFEPVRERVQRWANRLVYGERATPYEVLSNFASRMTGTYTLPELLPQIAATVAQGLAARRVEVWVAEDDELVRHASWPEQASGGPASLPLPVDGAPSWPDADRVVPVRHHGELLGLLSVTKAPGESVTTGEDKMLHDVASQAGLVLRNVRLLDDVRASRERLVAAQDSERRRLERNLHDGAQQSLISVALLLRMAAGRVPAEQEALALELGQVSEQLQLAIAELRELARGIHPALLSDRGLGAALTSLAERSPVPVVLEVDLDRRPPATVEGTVYFVVAEALTNVVRYAEADQVTVTISATDRQLTATVVDDGVGGADASHGSGLLGLRDRVAAVEGTLDVASPPGEGTRLTCRVPLEPVVAAAPASAAEPSAAAGAAMAVAR